MRGKFHPSGVVSLLALILMATVTATSVGAAAIILNELRQTESLDQAMTAVYAAEAGLEDGLYIIKTRRSTETLGTTDVLLDNPASPTELPNSADWSRSATIENQFIISRLTADTTAHMDVFDPDDPVGGSGIYSLWVTWSVNCQEIVQLETTMLTWEVQGGQVTFDPSTQKVFKYAQACNQGASNQCDDIIVNNIDGEPITGDRPYRFNFRVLVPEESSCSAENIVVSAYDVDNPANLPPDQLAAHRVDIPTRIEVKTTGAYSRSRQALTASVPWRAPVSGLLSFVIFSDEPLQK